MKKIVICGLLVILLVFSFFGCNDNDDSIIEAFVTVEGLHGKTGKYLSVGVAELGGSGNIITFLLHTQKNVYINQSSLTVLVEGYEINFNPNGIYNVNLSIFDAANGMSTSDFKDLTNVQFTSGKATVSY